MSPNPNKLGDLQQSTSVFYASLFTITIEDHRILIKAKSILSKCLPQNLAGSKHSKHTGYCLFIVQPSLRYLSYALLHAPPTKLVKLKRADLTALLSSISLISQCGSGVFFFFQVYLLNE